MALPTGLRYLFYVVFTQNTAPITNGRKTRRGRDVNYFKARFSFAYRDDGIGHNLLLAWHLSRKPPLAV